MFLETLTTNLVKLRVTNTTATSFGTRLPTATEPTGTGNNASQDTAPAVFNLIAEPPRLEAPSAKNRVLILPFGAGSDTNTFSLRVIGWRCAYDRGDMGSEISKIWIPVPLGEFSCAISDTPVGLAGKAVTATDKFCDTISLVTNMGNDDVDLSIMSPQNDTIGHIVMDLKGFQKMEITFDMTGATSGNALVAWY